MENYSIASVKTGLPHQLKQNGQQSQAGSFAQMMTEVNKERGGVSTPHDTGKIFVGKISASQPTVSELLMGNTQLREQTWSILGDQANASRDFTRIQEGTSIFYDPITRNLSWSTNHQDDSPLKSSDVQPEIPVQMKMAVNSGSKELQSLGSIASDRPTVSHLLKANPEWANDAWEILASKVNKGKDFRNLREGTEIVLNTETKELSWHLSQSGRSGGPGPIPVNLQAVEGVRQHPGQQDQRTNNVEGAAPAGAQQLLGTIDSRNNTVSHLLSSDPRFSKDVWAILNSAVNMNKPFDRIPLGTEVYIHPDSAEISWLEASSAPLHAFPARSPQIDTVAQQMSGTQDAVPATDLTEAVRPFMGKAYSDIDCYELLVAGLRRMDIQYEGKNGLVNRLTSMARERGLPLNAYMNGEGIVKAAGSLVYQKDVGRTSDWKAAALQLMQEIEPHLDKGQILSFSTQNRGHTGIISQQDNQWTFINSGRMDNSLYGNTPSRGVGEEDLMSEIQNWFRLAHKRGESLSITLGRLEQEKILAANSQHDQPVKRI